MIGRGWRPSTPNASGSACWFKFIDRGAAGFREPPGCVGAAMFGCGSVPIPILKALPCPLGSTVALFIPPAFPGPRGIPLIGTFPVPAEPAGRENAPIAAKPACPPPCPPPPRANEAAGGVKTMHNATAIFIVLLDIRKFLIHQSGEPVNRSRFAIHRHH